MYPLQAEYIAAIDDFLKGLHAYETLQVRTNTMSTQVFGEMTDVFKALQVEIEKVYGHLEQCPFVIKVLKNDVSEALIKDY